MILSVELARDFISLSGDCLDLLDSGACLHAPHLERLVSEYYEFRDRLNNYLMSSFPDDYMISAGDFWPDLGYIWLAVRMGHGVDFADCVANEFRHVADFARVVAKSQPYLEDGAYLGDDGIVYAYNYHE